MRYVDQNLQPYKPPVQPHNGPSGTFPTIFALALYLTVPLATRAQSQMVAAHISRTLYFRSESDESASRAALHVKVSAEAEALASTDLQSLSKELDRCEALIAALQTHGAYLKIRTLEDTQDQTAKKAQNEVRTDQSVLEAAMDSRLRRLSTEEAAALGRYALLAKSSLRDAARALSPDTERYRGSVVDPSLISFSGAYDQIETGLARPKDASGADVTIRRKALTTWNDAYNHAAPETATLLGAIVELEIEMQLPKATRTPQTANTSFAG